MTIEQAVIDVRGLRMSYGSNEVLHGVDLQVRRGEVLALLGPNGAGKTTTIEILEGFRKRSGGEVTVLGADPGRGDEAWRARLGIVLQSWRDHGKWKVGELLHQLGRYYTPYSKPYDPGELMALVGLTDQGTTKIAHLSGGQRRRLDVALGLVGRPELLFLDEPTVGFDPQARQEFHDLVRRLSDMDTTILLTTHDLDEAEKLADRIVILAGGRIIVEGTALELAKQVSGKSEVRFSKDGEVQVHSVDDPAAFLREVLDDSVHDLEVRRVSLQGIYLSMVAK
jgi:ABC-2 type transport system ATP-binding protein